MPEYRVFRLKENLRSQFRWAPHLSGVTAVKPKDYEESSAIEAETPGAVAYQSLDAAVRMIAEGKAGALVTGPISKKNLAAAGYDFPGHTEILEKLAAT